MSGLEYQTVDCEVVTAKVLRIKVVTAKVCHVVNIWNIQSFNTFKEAFRLQSCVKGKMSVLTRYFIKAPVTALKQKNRPSIKLLMMDHSTV